MDYQHIRDQLGKIVQSVDIPIVLAIDINGEASFVLLNKEAAAQDALHKSSTFHCMVGVMAETLAEYEDDSQSQL